MNIKQMMGVVGGLAAFLGAGCDKNLKTAEASCEIASGIEARLFDNQISLGKDYPSIELYSNKTYSVLLNAKVDVWGGTISCMDGRVISWRKDVYGNLEVKKYKLDPSD
ncbi:MAG TPA: hypothetical protein VJG31_02105 [Candidatus Nanoarchaeia archaeon]|nr:hypothetical protein [Candidatus Nanoarchaeia archaeon]